jgi:transcriptional regulator with XRE-family HTH domain
MKGKLSDQVRDAVNGSGLSRYRICREIGLNQGTLSRFMSGKSGLSLESLDRLGELLGLELTIKPPKRKGN